MRSPIAIIRLADNVFHRTDEKAFALQLLEDKHLLVAPLETLLQFFYRRFCKSVSRGANPLSLIARHHSNSCRKQNLATIDANEPAITTLISRYGRFQRDIAYLPRRTLSVKTVGIRLNLDMQAVIAKQQ